MKGLVDNFDAMSVWKTEKDTLKNKYSLDNLIAEEMGIFKKSIAHQIKMDTPTISPIKMEYYVKTMEQLS